MDLTNGDRAAPAGITANSGADEDPPAPAGEAAVMARFEQRRHDRLAPLVTPELVIEHRRTLRHDVSPSLRAVLVAMRQEPVSGKLVVHETAIGREWCLLRLSGRPGVPHRSVDDRRFVSLEDALHAAFLQRLADWNIEIAQ